MQTFIINKNGQLITGSWDGFKVWDLSTGECLKIFNTDFSVDQLQFCAFKGD